MSTRYSPVRHDSLKARFEHEKSSLEALATTDVTLQENGIVVNHSPLSAPTVPTGHSHQPRHTGTSIRLHDHGAAVEDLQRQLESLGYTGTNGQHLHADGQFGPNTRTALEAFQRDHNLHVDGVAGSQTFEALRQAQPAPSAMMSDPGHAGHEMYTQALRVVHDLDTRQGRTPDQLSSNLAGALAAQSRLEGMHRIDHLVLSDDATRAYAVQGDLNSPFKQYASVDIAHAVVQPFEQSSQAWTQAQQQQQQMNPQSMDSPQQAAIGPGLGR